MIFIIPIKDAVLKNCIVKIEHISLFKLIILLTFQSVNMNNIVFKSIRDISLKTKFIYHKINYP